ncbi:cutinase family protein [Gordonia sp. ABSL1-1]|uniref:cutinase family protein n=1 Tax=Gordonia sp. ABSL1-1 TaxID=3053923 RepID=UPI002573AFA9|nr:cutinase family protein [Gordonia sp. ABSL1-1]MDL9937648.1 cutinase family protein [Gordonia sp. ABSL1-1]
MILGALAILAIVLIVVAVIQIFKPGPSPFTPTPPPTSPSKERPQAQPADCPDVLTLVVPGTWESSAGDDPIHPTANPRSLMLRVSKSLQGAFADQPGRTEVYTVPYTAEFRNPTNLGDRQADYNVSRTQGYKRAAGKIIATNKHCPLTRYVLLGFSQGAVIAGDLASNIGNGRGVLDPADKDLVLGVGLIADGRREPGEQHDIGPSPDGVGAEVRLAGFGGLVPGITMTGSRNGGFGELSDRVQSICAPGDLICDAPSVTNPLAALAKLSNAAANPIHALYATTSHWEYEGASATQWMYGWARAVIDGAEQPEHE